MNELTILSVAPSAVFINWLMWISSAPLNESARLTIRLFFGPRSIEILRVSCKK